MLSYLLDEKKWKEMVERFHYDLDLAKWLLISLIEKDLLKRSTNALEDKSEARTVNKLVMDALVNVRLFVCLFVCYQRCLFHKSVVYNIHTVIFGTIFYNIYRRWRRSPYIQR